MHFISKFSDAKPSVTIMTDIMVLIEGGADVIMYRKRHAGNDAVVYFMLNQGHDASLIPIFKKPDGSFYEIELEDSLDRWDYDIGYMHDFESDQGENDAMVLANLLFMSGVVDGFMGRSFGSETLAPVLADDAIERDMFVNNYDPCPDFDKESKYGIYFKDSLTDAYYPVEKGTIWSQLVMEAGWYEHDGQMFLVREARYTHPDRCRELGIAVRKAMHRIENNDR